MAPRDRDKSSIGERITGEHDPDDPDGLLTVDGVTRTDAVGLPDVDQDAAAASGTEADTRTSAPTQPADSTAGDEYPTIPDHKGITS